MRLLTRQIRAHLLLVAATCCLPLVAPIELRADIPTPDAPSCLPPIPDPPADPQQPARPRIELVFVLDTTGSMSGLIEGAKQKIWSIAKTIIAVKGNPRIKIGLVAYRDRGDEYVTRRVELTDDIDAVFNELMTFKADGGNDTPESVNQALADAVGRMGWSEAKDVTKILFLVGDAPPHMDYANDVPYADTCAAALRKGIRVNAVQCGTAQETTPIWTQIAKLGKGQFIPLAQEGGMVAIATPQDEALAALNGKVSATVVPFGTGARQRQMMQKMSAATTAPAGVAADRAEFLAKEQGTVIAPEVQSLIRQSAGGAGGAGDGGGASLFAARAAGGEGDLVFAFTSGQVKLEDVPAEQLPEKMKSMTLEQRKAYLVEQQQLRAKLQSEINALSAQREKFLLEERAKQAGKPDSFDAKVIDVVNEQAASKP